MDDSLKTYREKRDFAGTPEPEGKRGRKSGHLYIIQKHAARRLHYDFRLELDGVLKSWAVTKGPSLDPSEKRLAVRTEDHPLEYGTFEGVIPQGYGAGTVMLWDRGEWQPQEDPQAALEKGALSFRLDGERLRGDFSLVRMQKKGEKRENWLLIKKRDGYADDTIDPLEKWTTSVASERAMSAITSNGAGKKKRRNRKANGLAKRRKKRPSAPRFVAPQLATLRKEPPTGDDWLHEVKYDGYRIQCIVADGEARLVTRNEKDWTRRYPGVARAAASLDVESAAIDGELVALDSKGHSSFAMLQKPREDAQLVYYAFDLLSVDGENLRSEPLRKRKQRLEKLLKGASEPLRYSDHIEGDGDRVIARACAMNLEGIVSKRAGSAYRSGRGTAWIKSKCTGNDEFVIAGYRESDKRGRPFSSLLLGEFAGGSLEYRGRVGTGFDDEAFNVLTAAMRPLRQADSPYAETPREARDRAVWLKPELVAQIAYTEKTTDGRLRHPSFLGLREDKPAAAVAIEPARKPDDALRIEGVRLTHPDKVMFPQQGVTKRDIAEYYQRHADKVLPYLKDRPLSLVRCPSGRDGKCFFQKHHTSSTPEHMEQVLIEEKDGGKQPYLVITSTSGLVASAQLGVLELHLWGSRADRIDRPERLVFDLDPDEGLAFAAVKSAARELRDVLDAAGLESFPLLTGGKGIHVVVPLQRRRGWEDVRTFARGLARQIASADPKRYVATASKAKRRGRIFIDWLRNDQGSTAIAPYSPRARPGAPVATPLSWGELARADSAAKYTLQNIDRRLGRQQDDPWAGYFELRQSITDDHLASVEG